MQIKPINGRILLKKISKDKNYSGIIIPEEYKELPSEGIVLDLNKNNIILKSELNIGDKVLFNKYSGQELKLNDLDLILIKEEDILAVIN